MVRSLRLAAALAFAFALAFARPASADDAAAQRLHAFKELLAEHWAFQMKDAPEFATLVGDPRYNDRWSDHSPAHALEQKRIGERFLARFAAVDTRGFGDDDALNQQLVVRQLHDAVRAYELRFNEMPLDPIGGVHLQIAGIVSSQPFATPKDYADYLARLHRIPDVLDQVRALAVQGMKDGLVPPRFLLDKVSLQLAGIERARGAASVFARPLEAFPKTVARSARPRLRQTILAAIEHEVRPAFRRLRAFVRDHYAPHGREEPGLWALPDGEALYRFAIQLQTTTDLAADEIHRLGLAEVERIEAEMAALAKREGYADLAAFRAAVDADPRSVAASREEILDRYRAAIARMQAQLPRLFGRLPTSPLEVVAVDGYREKDASMAEYQQATPDGSRPARISVNTGDYAHRSTLPMEATAYHEGVPGHHLQISIAQSLPELPPFRQQATFTAYTEGWALYAERLGKELGFYADARSDYGRLANELLRADRLVLDTGVHAKHWTRQQMIDFFHAHSSQDEPTIQAEVDRYIAWPGQALAYKVGELEILALRDYARGELGDAFDLRAFHDAVLGAGSLPLDVLEARIHAWTAVRKSGANAPVWRDAAAPVRSGGCGDASGSRTATPCV